ncbi:MAG TPA: hypothetical protein VN902_14740 [Candidatus Acidoferrales bacterium]|jgi:photosystem II stability/assembly factor-like uncharacterized protein|nr:hypothetical protein [Candidatus Acidoferrales bacterium]
MTKLRKGEVLLVGAAKGGFIFRSDARRKNWSVSDPRFTGLMVHHFTFDPRDCESRYAATYSEWRGSDIPRSRDGGRTWKRTEDGSRYAKDSGLSVSVRHIHPAHANWDTPFAGVDSTGLFRSDDRGLAWTEVEPLNRHESRGRWSPGKGGLILYCIVPDPHDKMKMHVAISAAGVFYTEDGGRSWQPRNRGTRADFLPDKHPDLGQCVHKLLPAADGKRLYQQNHSGVYRSDSSAERRTGNSEGLAFRYGFCVGTHPKDAANVWVVPITSSEFHVVPDGKLTVFRPRDAGRSWQRAAKGLPDRNAQPLVLREAMSVDSADASGVYCGTSSGQIFRTRDEGASGSCWRIFCRRFIRWKRLDRSIESARPPGFSARDSMTFPHPIVKSSWAKTFGVS